jgi:hypothetical protein
MKTRRPSGTAVGTFGYQSRDSKSNDGGHWIEQEHVPAKLAGWFCKTFGLGHKAQVISMLEEYRSRWGARASNPLEGAQASSVGSTPASSANSLFAALI